MSQILKPRKGYKLEKWFFSKDIEIPQEWELVNFERFTKKITYGFTNPMPTTDDGAWMITATNIKNGKIVYEKSRKTSWNAYNNLITIKSRPKKGLILITKDGTLGEVAIVDRDNMCINQSLASIEYDNSKISSDYLLLSLQSKLIKQFIDIFSPQTTIRHIYITDIPNWKIPLPSLQEQQKIATILSNIDNLINSTQKIIEQIKSVKKGLMQKLLTRGIDHKKFKQVSLGRHFLNYEIPEEWDVKNVKELSTLQKNAILTGPFGLMLHSSDYVSVGTPMILIKNIQNGKIDDDDIPKISKDDVHRLLRYTVKEGDIVFSRVGRVGSSALIERKHVGWLISGQLLRIRFENLELNSEYLNYFFHSHIFSRILIPELVGSTRDSINTSILENYPIIIPSKIEQDEIVSILSNIDSQIQSQTQYQEKLEKLKKSLMQKLLTGQVRVAV